MPGPVVDAFDTVPTFFLGTLSTKVQASHIPGSHNDAADALSRNNLSYFRSIGPAVHPDPTSIPSALGDMLLLNHLDWTSSSWRRMFVNTLSAVWHHQPDVHTNQRNAATSISAQKGTATPYP